MTYWYSIPGTVDGQKPPWWLVIWQDDVTAAGNCRDCKNALMIYAGIVIMTRVTKYKLLTWQLWCIHERAKLWLKWSSCPYNKGFSSQVDLETHFGLWFSKLSQYTAGVIIIHYWSISVQRIYSFIHMRYSDLWDIDQLRCQIPKPGSGFFFLFQDLVPTRQS